MKTRIGYVSNSSSSSFCIVGVTLENAEFDFDRDALKEKFKKKCGRDYSDEEVDGFYDGYLLYQVANYIGEKNIADFDDGFEIRRYIENEDYHVGGMSITRMDLNETLLQFKTRVLTELKKIGFKGTVDDIDIIIDGGRDC